jgi:hypothetical protein
MDALIAARNAGTAAMLLWNDEEAPSNDTATQGGRREGVGAGAGGSSDGHTKGILVGGTSNTGAYCSGGGGGEGCGTTADRRPAATHSRAGVFITHSVPLFPTLNVPFTWTTSTTYGQHLLCVSLTSDVVEQAALQLQVGLVPCALHP